MNVNEIISVSTVTPVYSGADYLVSLVEELNELKSKWLAESAPVNLLEAIFVDDGSIDDSVSVLNELQKKYDWIRVVTLSRNYGQHAATVAGICHTSTDWVVTLDEDLQHKPELINELFKCQTQEQVDVVYARPKNAVHGNSWRDKSSRLVKRVIAKLTSTPQIKLFNSFRLVRGSIARAAASSSSSNTYLDIAISWFTKSCSSIEIDLHDQRFVSESASGYGFLKLVKHARRLIVSSEIDVASTGLVIGFCSIVFAVVVAIVSIFEKLFFPEVVATVGWTSLISAIAFFSGIIIALLCIALEYINIVMLNNLGRPTFFTVDRSQDNILKAWFCKLK